MAQRPHKTSDKMQWHHNMLRIFQPTWFCFKKKKKKQPTHTHIMRNSYKVHLSDVSEMNKNSPKLCLIVSQQLRRLALIHFFPL